MLFAHSDVIYQWAKKQAMSRYSIKNSNLKQVTIFQNGLKSKSNQIITRHGQIFLHF
jgi:hypothetical protein